MALAACGGDDGPTVAAPPGGGTSPPTTLTVLGRGAVDARFTAEVTVRGPWAYTSSWGQRGTTLGNLIYVWDVSGPVPMLRDSVQVDPAPGTPTITTTGDVQVSDDGQLLVVATEPAGSLVVYSLADPQRPRLLSRFVTAEVAAGVHTAQLSRVNGRLYAFCALDMRGSTPARLAIVDLGDPAAPRQLWVRAMGAPLVHDTYVHDGWLLTANWNGGLVVWDIGARGTGSPASPDSVGAVRTVGGKAHNVWWGTVGGSTRWAIVGEEGPGAVGSASSGDVHVVDMADPARPREVAVFGVAGAGTHNFSVDEERGVLYAAYYNAGVRALDIRGDLGTCTTAQKRADGRCDLALMGRELGRGLSTSSVYIWGVEYAASASETMTGGLYASDMLGGLWKLAPFTR